MQQMLARIALFIIVISVSSAYCYYKGMESAEQTYEAAAAIHAKENAEKVAAIILETEAKTRALQYELRKAKAGNTLPDKSVSLSIDFCRMYNADVGMPESPCSHPVTVETVADTNRENFSACRQNAIWLLECQQACSQ